MAKTTDPTGCVLIHYRSEATLLGAVREILTLGLRPDRIVIVDNGSEQGFAGRVRQHFPEVIYLARPDNPGYATAANVGLRHLKGLGVTIAIVATHEIQVRQVEVAKCRTRFEEDPSLGLLGPLVINGATGEVWSRGGKITFWARNYHKLISYDDVRSEPDYYGVDWIDGCFMFVRMAAWDEVGGVDERYFLYVEEIDFAWKMRQGGWRVAVDPAMVVVQRPGNYPRHLAIRNNAVFLASHGHIFSKGLWVLFNIAAVLRGSVTGSEGRRRARERVRALREARKLAE
jgi:N-acetylglucosaminyl-diphospho-decaprenol L-rhamnosyltransferase